MASESLQANDRLESMRLHFNAELQLFIETEIENGAGDVAKLCGEVLLAGGKRIRPLLILLAHEIAGGVDSEEVMSLALSFELIHTATLVHDDINDQASHRRGVETIHSKEGIAKGIIAGDWLFARGFGIGGKHEENVVNLISKCCADIAISEFDQLDHILDLKTSPEDYLDIVRGKTAGPFAAGCEAAGLVAGLRDDEAKKLGQFGMELGIAFQLVDDLLDLRGDEEMGKPRGADVLEGKMTLPLIHSLTILHGIEREQLADILNNFSDDRWQELTTLLVKSGSFEYVEQLIMNHIDRALNHLDLLPESNAKNLMKDIAIASQNRRL